MSFRIHPSILSADFANFESEFQTLDGADALHIDVMDGHFVPNLTFGLPVVKRLVEVAKVETDIHLMIENVDTEAVKYADTGANSVTFHWEASSKPFATAKSIRSAGARAALAVKPNTDISVVLDSLNEFDMLLVMTVEPGFGGQKYLENMVPKIEAARAEVARLGLDLSIQVDGGIDRHTIASASAAGADCFVAGSAVFGSSDRPAEIDLLRQIASEHSHLK